MKRFIFRRPVSKFDKMNGMFYLKMAEMYFDLMSCTNDSDHRFELMVTGSDYLNEATKSLGFKNASDMYEYMKRKGKF